MRVWSDIKLTLFKNSSEYSAAATTFGLHLIVLLVGIYKVEFVEFFIFSLISESNFVSFRPFLDLNSILISAFDSSLLWGPFYIRTYFFTTHVLSRLCVHAILNCVILKWKLNHLWESSQIWHNRRFNLNTSHSSDIRTPLIWWCKRFGSSDTAKFLRTVLFILHHCLFWMLNLILGLLLLLVLCHPLSIIIFFLFSVFFNFPFQWYLSLEKKSIFMRGL